MGSKARVANEIIPIILRNRIDQTYVEPFVGGCNIIDKITGKRIGADNNQYLIQLLKSLQSGYTPVYFITREEFYNIKLNKDKYPKEVVALCGILASYNGNWFRAYGGYSKTKNGKDRNYYQEGVRNLMRQVDSIKNIEFHCCEYNDLQIPDGSIIYCDPPYQSTDKTYKEKNFNHDAFFEWCRYIVDRTGSDIYIYRSIKRQVISIVYGARVYTKHIQDKGAIVQKNYSRYQSNECLKHADKYNLQRALFRYIKKDARQVC